MSNKTTNEYFMYEALKEAKKAYKKKEVPIGAVIVKDNKIISRGHNLRESKNNPLYHAEIMAIDKASKKTKQRLATDPNTFALLSINSASGSKPATYLSKANSSWRLSNTKLYVTIEPCPMCIGAIINARISELIYGAKDKKAGACGSIINIPKNKKLNHRIKIKNGILEEKCRKIIQKFFRKLRKIKKKKTN